MENNLRLSNTEILCLKEMTGLIGNMSCWKGRPWIMAFLLVAISYLVMLFGIPLYFFSRGDMRVKDLMKQPVPAWEGLLVIVSLVALVLIFGFLLRLLIYKPKIKTAKAKLTALAISSDGIGAIEKVHNYLEITQQFYAMFRFHDGFYSWSDLDHLDKMFHCPGVNP